VPSAGQQLQSSAGDGGAAQLYGGAVRPASPRIRLGPARWGQEGESWQETIAKN